MGDGCEPKWISRTQRASFYIDCTERFNINGFLSSAELNIRKMNKLAHKLRKHEKDSANARIGGGVAQDVGGLMSGIGIGEYLITYTHIKHSSALLTQFEIDFQTGKDFKF